MFGGGHRLTREGKKECVSAEAIGNSRGRMSAFGP